jgi:nucleoside-diphosphate-sugar epimerase
MRVFVVGASGTLGTRLVAQLVERGHEVTGSYHSAGHGERVEALGAAPVRLDVVDAPAVLAAVRRSEPEAIVHEATALAAAKFGRSFDKTFAATNRIRTDGTDAVLAAAQATRVRTVVAQSFAPYRYERSGPAVKSEQDRLDPNPPTSARETFAAMSHIDTEVPAAGGIALRYGLFYGIDDSTTENGLLGPIRKRRYPILGGGNGMMSFIHLDDAATATVRAVERGGSGIFNIVDDHPAPMREWVPYLAQVVGAKPPLHVPTWVGGLFAGRESAALLASCRGASNSVARRDLGWTLRYPSWREGFVAAYGH